MKINHVLIIGLLTTTAAYADQYTVDVYNLTSLEGTRKVYTLTEIAKNSKTSRLPKCAILQPIAGQQPSGKPTHAKRCTPGHSKFKVKMEGDLLDKVVIKLKTLVGTDTVTQVATYNIPAGLAGKNWKFIVFQDPETKTFQMCGFSKGTRAQEVATMSSLVATGTYAGAATVTGIGDTTAVSSAQGTKAQGVATMGSAVAVAGTGIGGTAAVSSARGIPISVLGYENFKKELGISQEWQDRECIGFVSVNVEKIKSKLK